MLARYAAIVPLALIGCRHAVPVLTVVRPEQACAGQLVLEFTNHLPSEVQVGWIRLDQLQGAPGTAEPIWLGVVGMSTAQFPVTGPGRVIFRAAKPANVQEDRSHVTHRLLCRTTSRVPAVS